MKPNRSVGNLKARPEKTMEWNASITFVPVIPSPRSGALLPAGGSPEPVCMQSGISRSLASW